jgi:catechol 2,3-dioxygenase-like lactoylglutathione lyase family enzyme
MGTGSPPAAFAACSIEIMVNDYDASLAFWCDVLGFAPAYTRPAQKFAYLQRSDGAQMMLYERDGDWETGPMAVPFGRGVVVQVGVADVDGLAAHVAAKSVAFYVGLREKWRDWGDCLGGQREFLVQDPDGYLVMVSQKIGTRPLA